MQTKYLARSNNNKKKKRNYKHQKNILGPTWSTVIQVYNLRERLPHEVLSSPGAPGNAAVKWMQCAALEGKAMVYMRQGEGMEHTNGCNNRYIQVARYTTEACEYCSVYTFPGNECSRASLFQHISMLTWNFLSLPSNTRAFIPWRHCFSILYRPKHKLSASKTAIA